MTTVTIYSQVGYGPALATFGLVGLFCAYVALHVANAFTRRKP